MDREYAAAVLAVLLVCAVECLARPRPGIAFTLMGFSAVWLPVDNDRIEGPVLVSIGETHGLTAADLIGLIGIAVATMTLLRLARAGVTRGVLRDPRVVLLIGAAATLAGFAVAFLTSMS